MRLAALREPVEHLAGAVDRDPLLVAGDQEADRAGETRRRARRESARAAAMKAAIAPFMSTAPRPHSTPSRSAAANGSNDQRLGGAGRHDVGMAGKAEIGAAGAAAGVEIVDRVGSPFGLGSSKIRRWQVKPSRFEPLAATMSSAPSSFGVTLGRRISSAASVDRVDRRRRCPAQPRSSVAQQLVDRGLGAGLRVDLS